MKSPILNPTGWESGSVNSPQKMESYRSIGDMYVEGSTPVKSCRTGGGCMGDTNGRLLFEKYQVRGIPFFLFLFLFPPLGLFIRARVGW